MTNDSAPRSHPHYGTCAGCRQLKHVTAAGLVREHNQYRATGTVVVSAALQRVRRPLPGERPARRAERLSARVGYRRPRTVGTLVCQSVRSW